MHWRVVIDIDQALCALVACDGSDLHLKVGSIPLARVDGELEPLSDDPWPVLTTADTEEALRTLIGSGDAARRVRGRARDRPLA